MKRLILTAIAVVLALPSHAKCGEDTVLATVEKMIRETYFDHDKDYPRPLTFSMVHAVSIDRALDKYTCAATMEFPVTEWDIRHRFARIYTEGVYKREVRYEAVPNARNPEKNVITLYKIYDLEIPGL